MKTTVLAVAPFFWVITAAIKKNKAREWERVDKNRLYLGRQRPHNESRHVPESELWKFRERKVLGLKDP